MSYKKEYYIDALSIVAKNRLNAEEEAQKNIQTLYLEHPDVKKIDEMINELGLKAVKSAVKLSGSSEIVGFQKEYEKLSLKREQLLSEYGINAETLSPVYKCKKCNDTGYVSGKLCDCVKLIAKDAYYKNLCEQMPIDKCKFSNFDLSLYPNEDKENMTDIFEFSKGYASDFTTSSKSLLFLGRTGLGKTHLSLSIANVVIDKGFGVIYGSSQNFLNQIQDEAFGRSQGDTLNALINCDLLILDDFGTEFMSSYISTAIYDILNSRILRSLPTIISSNLSLSEINSTYGERIMSRIIGNYVIKQFSGKDIRQIQMLRNNT